MKRATGGEIVQVEGGHILRSTGRKDRHSKVYTAKGPRDRRVRLSAHTAIQFYDVQDRLGYDRPSKVVDWLIKKAKNAIDKLAELPPWNPNEVVANNLPTSTEIDVSSSGNIDLERHEPLSNSSSRLFHGQLAENPSSSSSYMMPEPVADQDLGLSLQTNLHDQKYSNHSPNNQLLSFDANYDNDNNNNNPRIANWIIPHQQFLSQGGGTFSQFREPLQSNFSQLIHHAWEQRLMASEEHHQDPSISNFNGYFQFHGEEVNGVVCIKPSSGS